MESDLDEEDPVVKDCAVTKKGLFAVSRQVHVRRVETLKELPKTWTVPAVDDSLAYLLDLSDCDASCLDSDKKGNKASMISIIKDGVRLSFIHYFL